MTPINFTKRFRRKTKPRRKRAEDVAMCSKSYNKWNENPFFAGLTAANLTKVDQECFEEFK